MRSTALGGFASTQAGPQKTPPIGVTLEKVVTSVAASAAPGHLQAPFEGAALVALRYMALAGIEPDQAPPRQPPLDGGALEHQEALRYSTLAGNGPDQSSPQAAPLDGAALVACMHHQARHQPGREH